MTTDTRATLNSILRHLSEVDISIDEAGYELERSQAYMAAPDLPLAEKASALALDALRAAEASRFALGNQLRTLIQSIT